MTSYLRTFDTRSSQTPCEMGQVSDRWEREYAKGLVSSRQVFHLGWLIYSAHSTGEWRQAISPIDKLGHSSSASWSNLSRVIQLAHSHLNQGFQVFPQIHSAFPSRSHASMTPFPTTYFRGYRSWALTREQANVLIYHEGLHGQEYVLK